MGTEMRVIDLGGVKCFLFIAGGGFVLVDTGFAFQRPALEKGLEEAGCGPGGLRLIVLTHGDGDHVGNAAYLKAKYGAPLAMAREDAASAGGDPGEGRKLKLGPLSLIAMLSSIALMAKIISSGSMTPEPFDVDILLEDGRDLGDFGLNARVLRLSGHSRGSVGLLTSEGDLLAGDLFMNIAAPSLSAIALDGGEEAESVARIGALGIRDILPSHGRPFSWKRYAKSLTRSAARRSRRGRLPPSP
jgi:hydroxyacylglutathione hydrolase